MSDEKQSNFRQLHTKGHQENDPAQLKELREQVMGLIEKATGKRQVILAHTMLVDFFERDHNAAILLNQILYWTARASNPDGWFYKTYQQWYEELRFSSYQVWRVVRGDTRVQKYKRTLWSLGLETEVRMAPNGRNAVHYRLNIPAFMTAFTEWLQREHGLSLNGDKQQVQIRKKPRRRLSPFRRYAKDFGRATPHQRRQIWKKQHLLGEHLTLNIIEQSVGIAKDWHEVDQLLTDEIFHRKDQDKTIKQQHTDTGNGFDTKSKPYREVLPITENITPDVRKDWQNAVHMLKLHMKSEFDRLLYNHQLVDHQAKPDETFTVATQNDAAAAHLNEHWRRFIRRYVSDAIGRNVDVRFISHQKWRQKSPP